MANGYGYNPFTQQQPNPGYGYGLGPGGNTNPGYGYGLGPGGNTNPGYGYGLGFQGGPPGWGDPGADPGSGGTGAPTPVDPWMGQAGGARAGIGMKWGWGEDNLAPWQTGSGSVWNNPWKYGGYERLRNIHGTPSEIWGSGPLGDL